MQPHVPLIVRFSERRQGCDPTPGFYSSNHDMRLVREGEQIIPLVISRYNAEELKTVTKIQRERED